MSKILIVEDDLIIAKAIITKFKINDIDVELAVDGEEAFEKIKSGQYKVVLLDLLLPNKDGFWFLQKLNENLELKKSTKVLVLTNLNRQEANEKIKDFPIADYIIKSEISINDIIKKTSKLLSD